MFGKYPIHQWQIPTEGSGQARLLGCTYTVHRSGGLERRTTKYCIRRLLDSGYPTYRHRPLAGRCQFTIWHTLGGTVMVYRLTVESSDEAVWDCLSTCQ